MSSIYRRGQTKFSTSFNFGDHLGIGFSFGPGRKNEIAMRAQHFSNAGIKEPNPGKNFLELRYVCHLE
jgi:lipid A 3-O-deacylase